MNPSPEAETVKGRLWRLVDGYAGYASPRTRSKTCEVFEGFLAAKVVLIHSFVDKKFREFSKSRETHPLLIPLSESLKILSESTVLLEYDRKKLFYFFEEYRIPEKVEESLYHLDYTLLQQLSLIVDQIASFQLAVGNKFIDLNDHLGRLKEALSTRHQTINGLGADLKSRGEQLAQILRYIRSRKANPGTYVKLRQFIDRYPENLFIIREVLECFRAGTSTYLNLTANLPMISLYREALFYLEGYEFLVSHTAALVTSFVAEFPEEEVCMEDFKERLLYVPDFASERNFLLMSIRQIEERKKRLRQADEEKGKTS